MNTRIRTVGLAFALCAVSAVAKPVPDLKFQDLHGNAHKLSSLQGSVAVVNFWATWCGPCREEMPRLSKLAKAYAARNVKFVAVSADEEKDRGKIAPLLQRDGIDLEVWTGADIGTLDRLKLGEGLPATIVLDRDGTAIGRIEGEAHEEDVAGYLDWLLSDRKAPAPAALINRMPASH